MKSYKAPELDIYEIKVSDIMAASDLLSGGGDGNSDLDDWLSGVNGAEKFD